MNYELTGEELRELRNAQDSLQSVWEAKIRAFMDGFKLAQDTLPQKISANETEKTT